MFNMLKNRKGVILGVKNFLKNSITPTITPIRTGNMALVNPLILRSFSEPNSMNLRFCSLKMGPSSSLVRRMNERRAKA